MFRAHVLIIRRSKLHYTLHSFITPKQSEWSKITKIQFYKYEHIVVKFMLNFSGVITVYYLT